MPFRPPAPRLSDTVANELEQRILEASLKPGDRLKPERELAVELGVSRPSLREAIQKLVSKGLLVTKHGGGTHVTDRLEAHFSDPWQRMLVEHPPLQADILEFREMLEVQAAHLAAARSTEADLERLDAAHAAFAAAHARFEPETCVASDVGFHQAVAEASHNVLIGHLNASLMRVIHGHILRNLEHLHTRPDRWAQVGAQHRDIWQAIRRRDPDGAARAAREHIRFVRDFMLSNEQEDERQESARRRLGENAGKAGAQAR